MANSDDLLSLLQKSNLQLNKVLVIQLDNGSILHCQIEELLLFIIETKLANEIEFLLYLLKADSLTQSTLDSFFKYMLFHTQRAKSFSDWQKNRYKPIQN